MNCTVTDTTTNVQRVLQTCAAGTVHSVYRKTINLLLDGQLLALQAAGSPLSPLSLITDQTDHALAGLPICSGQPVTVSVASQEMIIAAPEPVCFSFRLARLHDSALHHILTEENGLRLCTAIEAVITHSDRNGFALIFQNDPSVEETLILAAAKRTLAQAKQEFELGAFARAAVTLCHVLGLGIGLTPSGDDFLCGVLAGLHLLSCQDDVFGTELRREILRQLHRTNEISAAFLHCAANGQFSQAVCRLSEASTAAAIAQSFSAIGHSSGMDTLCGIYYLIRLSIG